MTSRIIIALFFSQLLCIKNGFSEKPNDTTFYTVNNAIQSITEYNADSTVKKYWLYTLKSTISYYVTYEYTNKKLKKESYFDKNNALTTYSEYTEKGTTQTEYRYFNKDGILLSFLLYDSTNTLFWQKNEYIVYAKPQTARYREIFTYSNKWLSQINYFNNKDTNYATDTWKWNTTDSTGIYTSSINNNKTWIDAFTGAHYNKTSTFYRKLGTVADSTFVYISDSLLYKTLYAYSADGWLINDYYRNSKNLPLSHGEYTFDKTTFETTYKFFEDTAQKQLLTQTTLDYLGKKLTTRYFVNNRPVSALKYYYDDADYYTKISAEDSTGKLISYATYSYYKPYYFIQKYTTYDSRDSVTSYYSYDELGNVTDSVIVPVIFTSHPIPGFSLRNLAVSLHKTTIMITSPLAQSFSFTLTNVKGITLRHFDKITLYKGTNVLSLEQSLAPGIYFLKVVSLRGFFTFRLLVP